MRTSKRPACASLFSILLLPAMISAISIDCNHIKVKGISFNLSPLSGHHQVIDSKDLGESFLDTTYRIDLCRPLGKVSDEPDKHQCPSPTRVCGVERERSSIDNSTVITAIRPIAGDLGNYGGSAHGLEPSWTLLSESEATLDAGKEGLRLVLKGGKWPLKKTKGHKDPKDQQAIVELICDKERTGLEEEGEMTPGAESISTREEDEENPKSEASLTFVSYPGTSDKVDTLRLNWRTKYACEDMRDETDAAQRTSWGFFTWFFFIAFLGTAAYLIFGSWLNYTRYGARGWDLLPHGDTIRDVPYLMKDWTRKVVNTVQGGGSRGGYAAV